MTDERLEAKPYWASLPFAFYHQDGPQRRIIMMRFANWGASSPFGPYWSSAASRSNPSRPVEIIGPYSTGRRP